MRRGCRFRGGLEVGINHWFYSPHFCARLIRAWFILRVFAMLRWLFGGQCWSWTAVLEDLRCVIACLHVAPHILYSVDRILHYTGINMTLLFKKLFCSFEQQDRISIECEVDNRWIRSQGAAIESDIWLIDVFLYCHGTNIGASVRNPSQEIHSFDDFNFSSSRRAILTRKMNL